MYKFLIVKTPVWLLNLVSNMVFFPVNSCILKKPKKKALETSVVLRSCDLIICFAAIYCEGMLVGLLPCHICFYIPQRPISKTYVFFAHSVSVFLRFPWWDATISIETITPIWFGINDAFVYCLVKQQQALELKHAAVSGAQPNPFRERLQTPCAQRGWVERDSQFCKTRR